MKMKLLSTLFTITILIVTTSQALLIEEEGGIDNHYIYMTMSQGATTMSQPVTNANLRLVLENVNSTHEGSMNSTTSEDLDFQVNEDGLMSTDAWEGHPNYDATNISIYDSCIYAQELPSTDVYSLELDDTVTMSNTTIIVTGLAKINDLSYDTNIRHIPNGDDPVFISDGNTNKVNNIVSMPKPPKNTQPSLVSLVLSTLNVSAVRSEESSQMHASLSVSDDSISER